MGNMNGCIVSPESVGVSSLQLAEFIERFFALDWTHGLVVMRHGRIVAECYRDLCSPADRHQLFSLSKSFTSSAIGIALGEGLIPSLDATLVSFFPEFDSPKVTDRMRRVTLRHLLMMGMGRASCGLWGDRYGRLHDAFAASPAAAILPFGETARFRCGPNPFGLAALALSQDSGGATLEFTFGDGPTDALRAGYRTPRASQLRRVVAGHSFRAFARAAWTAPGQLRFKVAIPCSTAFFTMDLDLSAPSFHSNTPIMFAHSWMADVTIPLSAERG